MASEAIRASGLASRYAAALFELADEQRALDQTAQDLTSLKQMLAESPDLIRLIRSPLLSRPDQGRGLDAVLQAAQVSDLVRRFAALVARNRRLFMLPAMIDAFLADLAFRRGEKVAYITAVRPLSDRQHDALVDALRQSLGGKVSLSVTVNPAILGGLVVKVGSRMVDSSLRTKLNKLQLAMKGVG
ncbi:MAG: F0F1 ATP synthase subunit delta [Azospirillaceae bacterium]|nr:F0F1 ATP synthase subunit delta [Azospirillaceae bacterium]